MGGFSIWHWLIVLVIVVLVFGTKRLKNVGKDLGDAVKGFKDGVRDDDAKAELPPAQLTEQPTAQPVVDPVRRDAADTVTPRTEASPDDATGIDRDPR